MKEIWMICRQPTFIMSLKSPYCLNLLPLKRINNLQASLNSTNPLHISLPILRMISMMKWTWKISWNCLNAFNKTINPKLLRSIVLNKDQITLLCNKFWLKNTQKRQNNPKIQIPTKSPITKCELFTNKKTFNISVSNLKNFYNQWTQLCNQSNFILRHGLPGSNTNSHNQIKGPIFRSQQNFKNFKNNRIKKNSLHKILSFGMCWYLSSCALFWVWEKMFFWFLILRQCLRIEYRG